MASSPFSYANMMKNAAQNSSIGKVIGQGIARYRQHQQQAQQQGTGSPSNQMDMSPVASQTSIDPTANPAGFDNSIGGTGPVGYADEIGGDQSGAQGASGSGGGAEPLGMDTFGTGTIVTKPTIALLGDKGVAERIVPLNSNPNNKVNSPSVISRYRNSGM